MSEIKLEYFCHESSLNEVNQQVEPPEDICGHCCSVSFSKRILFESNYSHVRDRNYRSSICKVVENEPHDLFQRRQSTPRKAFELLIQDEKWPPEKAGNKIYLKKGGRERA